MWVCRARSTYPAPDPIDLAEAPPPPSRSSISPFLDKKSRNKIRKQNETHHQHDHPAINSCYIDIMQDYT